ncbi:hypothetical protein PQR62_14310 [Herbaspirillum lusitanum]|uniref:Uncharacterized protein n=1 Tax=Herbaspirillum lusitanum TaxID=213312 RepID=A0ABW9A9H4_9BURK
MSAHACRDLLIADAAALTAHLSVFSNSDEVVVKGIERLPELSSPAFLNIEIDPFDERMKAMKPRGILQIKEIDAENEGESYCTMAELAPYALNVFESAGMMPSAHVRAHESAQPMQAVRSVAEFYEDCLSCDVDNGPGPLL